MAAGSARAARYSYPARRRGDPPAPGPGGRASSAGRAARRRSRPAASSSTRRVACCGRTAHDRRDGREPLREGNEALLDDDIFHVPRSDEWWEHETSSCSSIRSELVGAGATTTCGPRSVSPAAAVLPSSMDSVVHMETPYYVNYTNTPLPEVRDLRDFTFPSGSASRWCRLNEHLPDHFSGDRVRVTDFALDWAGSQRHGSRRRARRVLGGGEPGEERPRHLDQLWATAYSCCTATRSRSTATRLDAGRFRGGTCAPSSGRTTAAGARLHHRDGITRHRFGAGPGGSRCSTASDANMVEGSKRREA